MRICPKCNSWRVQTLEHVIRSYHCLNCGWIEIGYIKQGLQSFPFRQHLRLLRRSSWVYVIFFLVILGGGYLISAMVITPAKYFAFQDKVPLFSEKIGTAGETKSKSVTTEALATLAPSTQAVPSSPVVSPAGADSVSLHQPEKYHVVANSKSRRYHLPGMTHYNKIPSDRRIIFTSEEAAQQAGYRKSSR